MFQNATQLFQKFKWQFAIKVALAAAARRALNKYGTDTFSQMGEDRILDFLFQKHASGFYVEVGCYHPLHLSNTFRLYRQGWCGLVIDANPNFQVPFRAIRPRDRFVNVAVSSKDGMIPFTEFDDPAMSSASEAFVKEWSNSQRIVSQRNVNCRRLTDILITCKVPEHFQLLCVDVEGHDLEVLQSLDVKRFQPEVILVEVLRRKAGVKCMIEQYLAENGYMLVAMNPMNCFFQRGDPTKVETRSQVVR